LGGAKYFDFKGGTVFGLAYRLSKHKTKKYARNFLGALSSLPGYACDFAPCCIFQGFRASLSHKVALGQDLMKIAKTRKTDCFATRHVDHEDIKLGQDCQTGFAAFGASMCMSL